MTTVTFRLRRDTAANWSSVDPVLALGEPGLETDTRKVKYGDGSTAWAALGYGVASAAAIPILSVGRATGTTPFMTIPGQTFTAIPLSTVAIDSASGYNTTTGIYTLPETGVYLITGKLRLDGSVGAGMSYGIGMDTSNADGSSFFWATTAANTQTGSNRHGIQNSRIYSGTVGDQLRLFAYVDLSVGVGIIAAELNIFRIR